MLETASMVQLIRIAPQFSPVVDLFGEFVQPLSNGERMMTYRFLPRVTAFLDVFLEQWEQGFPQPLFWVNGSPGTGRSFLALTLSNLVSQSREWPEWAPVTGQLRERAPQLSTRLDQLRAERGRLFIVHPVPQADGRGLNHSIINGLRDALQREEMPLNLDDLGEEELEPVLARLFDFLKETGRFQGMMVILEDFDPHFNLIAAQPQSREAAIWADFIRVIRASKDFASCALGILRHAPATYGPEVRKVFNGQEHTLTFADEFDSLLELVTTILIPNLEGTAFRELIRHPEMEGLRWLIDAHHLFPGRPGDWVREWILKRCYPIHPFTVYGMAAFCEAVAAPWRHTFHALSGSTPGSLRSFAETMAVLQPQGRLSLYGAEALCGFMEKQIGQVEEYGILAETLERSYLLAGGDVPLAQRLLKLMAYFRILNSPVLRPRIETIQAALHLPYSQEEKVAGSMQLLVEKKALIYDSASGEYALPGQMVAPMIAPPRAPVSTTTVQAAIPVRAPEAPPVEVPMPDLTSGPPPSPTRLGASVVREEEPAAVAPSFDFEPPVAETPLPRRKKRGRKGGREEFPAESPPAPTPLPPVSLPASPGALREPVRASAEGLLTDDEFSWEDILIKDQPVEAEPYPETMADGAEMPLASRKPVLDLQMLLGGPGTRPGMEETIPHVLSDIPGEGLRTSMTEAVVPMTRVVGLPWPALADAALGSVEFDFPVDMLELASLQITSRATGPLSAPCPEDFCERFFQHFDRPSATALLDHSMLPAGQEPLGMIETDLHLLPLDAGEFDLERLLEDKIVAILENFDLISVLNRYHRPQQLIPAEYSQKYNVDRRVGFRFFRLEEREQAFHWQHIIRQSYHPGGPVYQRDLLICYILADDEDDREFAQARIEKLGPELVHLVPAVAQQPFPLERDLLAIEALEQLRRDPDIRNRWGEAAISAIRGELAVRKIAFHKGLEQFLDPENFIWYWKSEIMAGLEEKGLSAILSTLLEALFPKHPRFHSGLVGNYRDTRYARLARKDAVDLMLTTSGPLRVLKVGGGAADEIYRTCLRDLDILRKVRDVGASSEFLIDESLIARSRLQPVWELLTEGLGVHGDNPVEVSPVNIFARLLSPPFGLSQPALEFVLGMLFRIYGSNLRISKARPKGGYAPEDVPGTYELVSFELLSKVVRQPEQWVLHFLKYTDEEKAYIEDVVGVFTGGANWESKGDLWEEGRKILTSWYDALPSIARKTLEFDSPYSGALLDLFRGPATRESSRDLFRKLLPEAMALDAATFNIDRDKDEFLGRLDDARGEVENFLQFLEQNIIAQVGILFDAFGSTPLEVSQCMEQWYQGLAEMTREHRFPGDAEALMNVAKARGPLNHRLLIQMPTRMGMGALYDWEEDRSEPFLDRIRVAKEEIDAFEVDSMVPEDPEARKEQASREIINRLKVYAFTPADKERLLVDLLETVAWEGEQAPDKVAVD